MDLWMHINGTAGRTICLLDSNVLSSMAPSDYRACSCRNFPLSQILLLLRYCEMRDENRNSRPVLTDHICVICSLVSHVSLLSPIWVHYQRSMPFYYPNMGSVVSIVRNFPCISFIFHYISPVVWNLGWTWKRLDPGISSDILVNLSWHMAR